MTDIAPPSIWTGDSVTDGTTWLPSSLPGEETLPAIAVEAFDDEDDDFEDFDEDDFDDDFDDDFEEELEDDYEVEDDGFGDLADLDKDDSEIDDDIGSEFDDNEEGAIGDKKKDEK